MSTQRRRRADRADLYQSSQFIDAATRIAVNVRRLRAERNWPQEAAAEACGLDIRVLQAVESGSANTTLVTLARLAVGFGIDLGELFTPTEQSLVKRRGRPSRRIDP